MKSRQVSLFEVEDKDPWGMLVQICEIYRDSPLAILLLHKDYVGQAIWMMDFTNKVGVPKFVNLNLNRLPNDQGQICLRWAKRICPCY